MSRSDEAWQEWDADPQNFGLIREAVFKAGFRAGAQAQWDASLREAFDARRAAKEASA